jgi:hypothetical protein
VLSALFSAFVGAGVIFYVLWIMDFDSGEWLGILRRVAGMGTDTAIRRYRLDTMLCIVRSV